MSDPLTITDKSTLEHDKVYLVGMLQYKIDYFSKEKSEWVEWFVARYDANGSGVFWIPDPYPNHTIAAHMQFYFDDLDIICELHSYEQVKSLRKSNGL